MLENLSCPLCSSKDFKIFQTISPFQIVKCQNCGLIYLNPRVKKDFIRQYYPTLYYRTENSDPEKILNGPYELEKMSLLKNFGLLRNKRKYILDVGCNKGEFLENLKRSGFGNTKGVEFDQACVEFARVKYGLDIFAGKFENYPKNKQFDIITFWHSLEHFYDINSVIKKAAELLKPEGIIVVSAPNVNSLQAKLMGKYWYHIDMPRHLVFFNKRTLHRFLKNHNFIIIACSYKYPSHNLDGWYNSFLNIWNNFKRKTFYVETNYQQQPIAKKITPVGKIIILRLIKICMLILSSVEMAFGSGGTITITAKRLK